MARSKLITITMTEAQARNLVTVVRNCEIGRAGFSLMRRWEKHAAIRGSDAIEEALDGTH